MLYPHTQTPSEETKPLRTLNSKDEAILDLQRRLKLLLEFLQPLASIDDKSRRRTRLNEARRAISRTRITMRPFKITGAADMLQTADDELLSAVKAVLSDRIDDDTFTFRCLARALDKVNDMAGDIEVPNAYSLDVTPTGIPFVFTGTTVAIDLPSFRFKETFKARFSIANIYGYVGFPLQALLIFKASVLRQVPSMLQDVLNEVSKVNRDTYGLVCERPYCYDGNVAYWIMPLRQLNRLNRLRGDQAIVSWGVLYSDFPELPPPLDDNGEPAPDAETPPLEEPKPTLISKLPAVTSPDNDDI